MTSEMKITDATVGSQENVEPESGILRGYAVPKVMDLYGKVKDSSSVIKSSLETVEKNILQPVEARIPSEWISRASDAGDKIDSLVTKRYNEALTTVNERVIQPINEKYVNPITETVNTRIVVPVSEVRKMSYDDVKGAASVKANEAALYWKDLRGEFSKKAIQRLEEGLSKVEEISATRGKELLHVDLIAYSKEVLGNASQVAKEHYYEPTIELLAKGVERANETREALQVFVKGQVAKVAPLTESVRQELRARLELAISAARDLSQTSLAWVKERYGQQSEAIFAKLPARAQDAVVFILNSPAVFAEVSDKADLTYSKGVVDNMQSLLTAIKEVYYIGAPPTIEANEAEGKAGEAEEPTLEGAKLPAAPTFSDLD